MFAQASNLKYLVVLIMMIIDPSKSHFSQHAQMTQLKALTSFDESPACAVGTTPKTSYNVADGVGLCSYSCKSLGRRTSSTTVCVGFQYDGNSCKLFSADQRLYFAVQLPCQFFLNVEVVGPNPPYVVCPASFTYNNQSNGCYKVINTTLDWDSSALYCQALVPGGHLVFINSSQEAVALSQTVTQFAAGCSDYWIGLQCLDPLSQSPLYWKLNSTAPVEPMTFSNWRTYEPSGGSQRCVEMVQGSYQWNDDECNNLFCFVCEVDL